MNITQRPIYAKPAKVPRNPAHMAKVAAMPCCICHEWGLPQLTPTNVHHCIHGRYGNRRVPDEMTIPLCRAHHQTGEDGYIALHREPAKWQRLYGPDHEWLSWVEQRL